MFIFCSVRIFSVFSLFFFCSHIFFWSFRLRFWPGKLENKEIIFNYLNNLCDIKCCSFIYGYIDGPLIEKTNLHIKTKLNHFCKITYHFPCGESHIWMLLLRLPKALAPTLVGTKLLLPIPPDRLRKSASRWVTQVAVLQARFCAVTLLQESTRGLTPRSKVPQTTAKDTPQTVYHGIVVTSLHRNDIKAGMHIIPSYLWNWRGLLFNFKDS